VFLTEIRELGILELPICLEPVGCAEGDENQEEGPKGEAHRVFRSFCASSHLSHLFVVLNLTAKAAF
jgi:hypothetical protein